jgi:hypothetical protein
MDQDAVWDSQIIWKEQHSSNQKGKHRKGNMYVSKPEGLGRGARVLSSKRGW